MGTFTATLLGTGSPIPDPNRAGPSTLIRSEQATILVDAGRGVMMRLAGAGASAPALDAIVLTHLHSDHICGLNDVITSAWVLSPTPKSMNVYGPKGTTDVIDGLVAMLAPDTSYRISHHVDLTKAADIVVHEVKAHDTFTVHDIRVIVGRTDHRPVEPSVGYRLECGERTIVVGGDGKPCAELDQLCAHADVYVQTVVREDLIAPLGYQRFTDILDYHSTVEEAANTAARNAVKTLVLTHMVPAVAEGDESNWRAQAKKYFDGTVIVGSDLAVISAEIPAGD